MREYNCKKIITCPPVKPHEGERGKKREKGKEEKEKDKGMREEKREGERKKKC